MLELGKEESLRQMKMAQQKLQSFEQIIDNLKRDKIKLEQAAGDELRKELELMRTLVKDLENERDNLFKIVKEREKEEGKAGDELAKMKNVVHEMEKENQLLEGNYQER